MLRQTFFADELWVIDLLRAARYVPHASHVPPLFFFASLVAAPIFIVCGTFAALFLAGDRKRVIIDHLIIGVVFVIAYFTLLKTGEGAHNVTGDIDAFFTNGPVRRFFDGSPRFVFANTAEWIG